jgi:hypothetical protein
LQRLTLRYPTLFSPLFRIIKKAATPFWGGTEAVVRSGNWYGNDTAWRMVHDINRCLLYSDGEQFPMLVAKRYLAIVDGVVAGEGNGPATPDRLEAGLLVAGFNPVAVDCATTHLMGFNALKLPMLREAFAPHLLPLANFRYEEIFITSNVANWQGLLVNLKPEVCFHFRPHFGWINSIELHKKA